MQNRRAFVNTFAVAMTIFIVVAASDSMAQNASHPSPETLVMTNARTAMLQATGVAQQAAPAHHWEIDRWYHWYNWNVWQDCAKDAPRSNPDDWYDAHPDAMKCMTGKFQARTAALEHFVAQVKAGAALDDALKAIEVANSSAAQAPTQSATVAAPAAVNVSPWNGSAAKLVHNSNGSLLEYTDTAGTQHQYAVARPKMLQGMAGDLGSWLYVSPDKKSGTMFQLGADGSVRGDPVNPAKLAFLVGP